MQFTTKPVVFFVAAAMALVSAAAPVPQFANSELLERDFNEPTEDVDVFARDFAEPAEQADFDMYARAVGSEDADEHELVARQVLGDDAVDNLIARDELQARGFFKKLWHGVKKVGSFGLKAASVASNFAKRGDMDDHELVARQVLGDDAVEDMIARDELQARSFFKKLWHGVKKVGSFGLKAASVASNFAKRGDISASMEEEEAAHDMFARDVLGDEEVDELLARAASQFQQRDLLDEDSADVDALLYAREVAGEEDEDAIFYVRDLSDDDEA